LKAAKEIMGIIVGPKKDIAYTMHDAEGYTALLWNAKYWIDGNKFTLNFPPPLRNIFPNLETFFSHPPKIFPSNKF
jgi:hypothetical protein